MKKYIIALLVCVLALFSFVTPALANDDLPNVVDNANLLTDEEENELELLIDDFGRDNEIDIVILTADSLEGKTAEAYADDYYDYNGYGYGANSDGCLLLVSMTEREWHLSTTGCVIDALSDDDIEYIGNQIVGDLGSGDYFVAFYNYINLVESFALHDYDNIGDYDSSYDYYTGISYDDDNESVAEIIAIGCIIGAIVTLIVISILKGQMKSVRHKALANDYLVDGSFALTGEYDHFVTSHVSKTARQSESSKGGSSTHTGSSGTSHGGGGGRF